MTRIHHLLISVIRVLVLVGAFSVSAAEVSFKKDLAPILIQQCQICHGAKKAKGGYRVDTFERLLRAGDGGEPGITPGKLDASELFYRLTTDDPDERMPQDADPLPPAQVALFKKWIAAGAKLDAANPKAQLTSLVPPPAHPDPPKVYPRSIPITALAFGADGEMIFASGYHEVTVWNAAEGNLIRRIMREGERTYGLSVSPNGQWLAAASGQPGRLGEVRLFKTTDGALDSVLVTATDVMLDVAFSPKGDRLVAGGADGEVRVIDLATRKVTHLLPLHSDWVNAVAWDNNGSRIATASRDHTAKVYGLEAGKSLATYAGHGKNVRGVAFHPKVVNEVFTTGMDKKLRQWKVSDNKTVREVGIGGELFKLARAGEAIFVPAADHHIRRFQTPGQPKQTGDYQLDDWAVSVAISPDGKRMAAGGFDGKVRVWNLEDGKVMKTFSALPGLK